MSSNDALVDIARVFRGTFVHSNENAPVEVLEDKILGIDTEGRIAFIGRAEEVGKLSQAWGFRISDVKHLGAHQFFMPGLVDTHIHASQYSYTGTALDMPLLQWLNTYTFPVEAKYKDLDFSQDVYTKVVTCKSQRTIFCVT
ncbi:hypothetical protein JZ751_018900 [Albula glossodonta]|uniref:Guanine deaminase n=1 Tax=Albula glossodonta TaxID=121402 RepID=A0A8T2N4M3_9TELE|nr:hypothetical protein JZ751_018900 [Albula glossodonta]